ncbi:hypothetical protein OL239_14810 [Arthrobacter sp. ATA002]|uniref:hypothetical protein n=1 Tax=Arthrobacter sp. ATA002 TaxID=2991715 RepID=UPI0022A718EC|nr:hypothetical protein [Arthrobacter sp. ATA002]WAP51138.1 hypothetical protein OL239_14810 [Arthrobacter sp. ATA002]
MSKKQLGAAPGDENRAGTVDSRSWFGRLRAQPGFRAAAVAFVLTVVLGIGSTVAYAYWGQRNTVAQSVSTVRADLPVLGGRPACGWSGVPLFSNVVISQPSRPSTLPGGAAVIMDVESPAGKKSYFLKDAAAVRLVSLGGLESSLHWNWRLTITVTTAYLKTVPTQNLQLIPEADIETRASQAPQPASAYYYASFTCNRL